MNKIIKAVTAGVGAAGYPRYTTPTVPCEYTRRADNV